MDVFDDKKYWAGIQQGNMDSLGKLYDLYVDELFSYGISISTDKSSVLDGIHDLFLNLYKYNSNLNEVENVKAYLFRSLKRILHKKNMKKIICFESSEKLNKFFKYDIKSQSHETRIIELEQSIATNKKVNRAMRNLMTKNQLKVLHMRFEEDKSYEEIAESMSVSISSARTTIYRALKILRGGLLILLFSFI